MDGEVAAVVGEVVALRMAAAVAVALRMAVAVAGEVVALRMAEEAAGNGY